MKKHRKRRARGMGTGFGLEVMEGRQLLSGSVLATMPTWVINGTDGDDAISVFYNAVTQKFDLTVNGTLITSRPVGKLRKIVINGGMGNDTITLDTQGKTIAAAINGGAGNDTITGGEGNDTINGGDGDDTLYGGNGKDKLIGGNGIDALFGEGGDDLLEGGNGADSLNGGEDNDRLTGGNGDDTLIGGNGKDSLNGGKGVDSIFALAGRDSNSRDSHDIRFNIEFPAASVSIVAPVNPPAHLGGSLRDLLIDQAVARYRNLLGTSEVGYNTFPGVLRGDVVLFTTSSSLASHSDTNTQEQGVDEADLVETDGNYIYAVRHQSLVIIDVRDPANPSVVSTVSVEGNVSGLYLVGNRVAIVSSKWNSGVYYLGMLASYNRYGGEQSTVVSIVDVENRTQPAVIQSSSFTGRLSSSRMIGDQLYLVMGNNVQLPGPQKTRAEAALSVEETNREVTYVYATEAEYRQWLADHMDEYLPSYASSWPDGAAAASGSLLENLQYLPDGVPLSAMTTIVNLDVSNPAGGPAAIATAAGSPDTLYVSGTNLYVLTSGAGNSSWGFLNIFGGGNGATEILKFNLGVHSVQFDAAGHVDGSPLNSYSMDEYNGQLRIVTEEWVGGHATHSVYVLTDTGSELTVTGQVHDIGTGESLRSVLFVQDRAYVVTFRLMDPLFAIDLSDPDHPATAGELVIPGFSTYLFPIDHDHVIGIGQGQGAEAWNFHNVQVSLFDVSDLSHPVLVDQKQYGAGLGESAGSAAQYDPHGFSYFAEEGVVAIPLNLWQSVSGSHGGLRVLKVDPVLGFTELGFVEQSGFTERSLRIGDNLFALSGSGLTVVNLMNPSTVVGNLVLPPGPGAILFPIHSIRILQPITIGPIFAGPIVGMRIGD